MRAAAPCADQAAGLWVDAAERNVDEGVLLRKTERRVLAAVTRVVGGLDVEAGLQPDRMALVLNAAVLFEIGQG